MCEQVQWEHRGGCCANLNIAHLRQNLGHLYFAMSFTIPNAPAIIRMYKAIVVISNQVVNMIKLLKTWVILKGSSSFCKFVKLKLGFD